MVERGAVWYLHDKASAAELSAVMESSTLRVYHRLGQSFDDGMPLYLDDRSNVLGTRLLSKCRLGILLLMARVAKMLKWPPRGASVCCI